MQLPKAPLAFLGIVHTVVHGLTRRKIDALEVGVVAMTNRIKF